MGRETSIAWTDSTLNLAWGCTKVSAGCENCYMFRNSPIYGRDPSKVKILNIEAAKKRLRTFGEKVFVNSNSDTFHEAIPFSTIDQWFELFSQNRNHQFQVLTKRVNRALAYAKYRKLGGHEWPWNVWLGGSVEDQGHLFRIETLRKIEGPKIKFVSFEPLLGPIIKPDLTGINWIIIGGESGANARFMVEGWAQNLIDYTTAHYPDCRVFFKQKGGRSNRDGAGGDILNGKQYKEFPTIPN